MQYDNPLAEKEAIELQVTAGRLSAKSSHIPLYIKQRSSSKVMNPHVVGITLTWNLAQVVRNGNKGRNNDWQESSQTYP